MEEKVKSIIKELNLPDQVQLLTCVYRIHYVPRVTREFAEQVTGYKNYPEYCFGIVHRERMDLYISVFDSHLSDEKVLPASIIFDTIYHEVIHSILLEGQWISQSDNEPLVEWLGKNVRKMTFNYVR